MCDFLVTTVYSTGTETYGIFLHVHYIVDINETKVYMHIVDFFVLL